MTMLAIRIYESRSGPRIQLSDALAALGSSAVNSNWTVSAVEGAEECGVDAIGPTSAKFDASALAETRITGQCLLNLAKDTRQIIWGKFSAYEAAASTDPWIILIFFDSTWLEVRSTDETALARIARGFDEVRSLR